MQTKNKQSLDFEKPLLDLEKQLDDLMQSSKESDLDFSKEIQAIEKKIELTKRDVYSNLTSWQKVQLSRHPNRPYSPDLISRIFENFEELHGDRLYKDDAAVLGGPAEIDGVKVMVIAQQKEKYRGKSQKEFRLSKPRGLP